MNCYKCLYNFILIGDIAYEKNNNWFDGVFEFGCLC